MKIAVLANKDRQNQIFKDEHIEYLKTLGDVVLNEGTEGPDPAEAAKLASGADIIITSWNCPSLTGDIIENSPDLKLVIHGAGSVKGVVSDALWDKGVRLTGAAAALGKGVAETALGLTISSLKNFYNLANLTRFGGWNGQNDTVREVYDVTVGVIGAGFAGRHYIKLLQNFDADILLYDPTMSEDDCRAIGAEKTGLDYLMANSDIVSIHAPSLPATHHMINSKNLKLMKDRAVIINTARGTIINEADLIGELKLGRISACLDVTDPEPPSEANELRSLPNVILTPHIAGSVTNGKKRIGDLVISEIKSFLADGTLHYEIKKENIATIA